MNTKLANHYQIIRHLGGGGFGQTFLAKDIHLPGHPICVVKKLQPTVKDPATLEIAKRLFNREAETLYTIYNLSFEQQELALEVCTFHTQIQIIYLQCMVELIQLFHITLVIVTKTYHVKNEYLNY